MKEFYLKLGFPFKGYFLKFFTKENVEPIKLWANSHWNGKANWIDIYSKEFFDELEKRGELDKSKIIGDPMTLDDNGNVE